MSIQFHFMIRQLQLAFIWIAVVYRDKNVCVEYNGPLYLQYTCVYIYAYIPFKKRHGNYEKDFKHQKYENSSELAKYMESQRFY